MSKEISCDLFDSCVRGAIGDLKARLATGRGSPTNPIGTGECVACNVKTTATVVSPLESGTKTINDDNIQVTMTGTCLMAKKE